MARRVVWPEVLPDDCWGIIPAARHHVLVPGHLRSTGYVLQRLVEGMYHLFTGEAGVRRFQLRASGAYQVYARKTPHASPS
jgi:hypothetical protein